VCVCVCVCVYIYIYIYIYTSAAVLSGNVHVLAYSTEGFLGNGA